MDYYSCPSSCKICQLDLNLLFVKKGTPTILKPALATPHHLLPLPIGDVISFETASDHISHYVFFKTDLKRTDSNFLQQLRQALEHLLVAYYPLAGRIRATTQGQSELVCCANGVVFVEAHANTTLADLKQLEKTHWSELQYGVHIESSNIEFPPLIVQVTRLACGGFALGIQVSQILCDDMGIMHFVYAWINLALGKKDAAVVPVWDRAILNSERRPLRIYFPSLSLIRDHKKFRCEHERQKPGNFVPIIQIDLSFEAGISLLRQLLRDEFFKCNAFEALAAHIWRERTRALDIPHTKEVRLFFLADASYETHTTLPKAFYGHYAFNCEATTRAGPLVEGPLSYAVQLIQAVKASLVENFARYALDFADLHCPGRWPPVGVLFLTHEMPKDVHIEFGGGEKAYIDGAPYLPSHINMASLGHRSTCSNMLHIAVNNVPERSVEKLESHIRSGTPQFKMDCKL